MRDSLVSEWLILNVRLCPLRFVRGNVYMQGEEVGGEREREGG